MALGHCVRGVNKDPDTYNIACDIVINSNILKENDGDKSSITLKKYGESMHLTPSHEEGHFFTAEQVYQMLPKPKNKKPSKLANTNWDDHNKWTDDSNLTQEERENLAEWNKRLKDSCKAIEIRKASTGVGKVPLLAQRRLKNLTQSQIDWREILSTFIHEEIADYSFSPPDKRYQDSPFFLPDYNETDITVKNILFMIDTSGSMDDDMVTMAYSEIKGAIDQFDGRLQGLLGFFEAKVVPPVPFYDEDSFRIIKPTGGGGTSFKSVFDYIKKHMAKELPASIVILTDGYDAFPPESCALGVPVLWVINNEKIMPPWGKVARIKKVK
jgi:predicted metal-dependent peptidase